MKKGNALGHQRETFVAAQLESNFQFVTDQNNF